jgi:mRNA-degrading endonuclease RelE of RelBE toxin-antitoxin system
MKSTVKISFSRRFTKEYKQLKKRYKSIDKDFLQLLETLKESPSIGVEIKPNIRKIRMAVSAKGKGKSGGARVITFNAYTSELDGFVMLLTIYDKSDRENITSSEIEDIINEEGLD